MSGSSGPSPFAVEQALCSRTFHLAGLCPGLGMVARAHLAIEMRRLVARHGKLPDRKLIMSGLQVVFGRDATGWPPAASCCFEWYLDRPDIANRPWAYWRPPPGPTAAS